MRNPKIIGKTRDTDSRTRLQLDSYTDPADADCPGARKAKKEALKAAAAKWFPYGYGPSTGTNFVIEEIGYVSEDEEEFGDFQALRAEQEKGVAEIARRGGEKESWFDQYQTVRYTKKQVGIDAG